MDQRYVDTMRACKVILHNLEHLDENISMAQRSELERVLQRMMGHVQDFLEAKDEDEGLWIGEE